MNCKHCGEKIAVFSRYCENCGQEAYSFLEWMKIIFTPVYLFFKKRLWLTITLGIVLVTALVLGIIFGSPKYLDPTDYIITQATGYNGSGEIHASIDYEELCEDILGKAPDVTTKKGYEKNETYQYNVSRIKSSILISVDRSAELSNGDFYIATAKVINNSLYEEFGYTLKSNEYKTTLQVGEDTEKLDDPVSLDLFEAIKIKISGNNGSGSLSLSSEIVNRTINFASGKTVNISISCSKTWSGYAIMVAFPEDNDSYYVNVSPDKTYDLKNGDTVKLKLDTSNAKQLKNRGIEVTALEKTLTVSGLN